MIRTHHISHPRKNGPPNNPEAHVRFGLRGCAGRDGKFHALIQATFAVFAFAPLVAKGEDVGGVAEGGTYTVTTQSGAESQPWQPELAIGYLANGSSRASSGPTRASSRSRSARPMGARPSPERSAITIASRLLRIRGPKLTGVKGIRAVLKEPRDEEGVLLRHDTASDNIFSDLIKPSGSIRRVEGNYSISFGLDQQCDPARNVKVVRALVGRIELVIPTKDPGSIITASFAKDAGVPLQDAALKAAGVEITLTKPGDGPIENKTSKGTKAPDVWRLNYVVKDPKHKVIKGAEFFNARGEVVNAHSGGFAGSGGTLGYSADFRSKPPSDIVAKFYLITDKSVVAVPFDFKDVSIKQR